MNKFALFLIVTVFICSCATRSEKLSRYGIIIPQEDGIYVASANHKIADAAFEIALATAEVCCKKQGKRHVVLGAKVNEEEGMLEESQAKVVDVATDVAATVGGFFSPVDGILFEVRSMLRLNTGVSNNSGASALI